jgi:hypothetical protein
VTGRREFIGALPGLAALAWLPAGSQGLVQGAWATHSQYSTLPDAPARGFVVAHAAPMDRRPTKKGGPYTCPEVAQNGQYGVMDVHDDGARVSVRLQGMRGGLAVPGMRLEINGGQ